ncbi:hypothetical protein GF380_01020 [Candidatus Uhrbacteria bacterium]|nr:hypothetical protein [Candidatus Uhrbacteria bacterium]MBD3283902.1 hypothetical protein [Candidatus Uhrbacteria bacterium]
MTRKGIKRSYHSGPWIGTDLLPLRSHPRPEPRKNKPKSQSAKSDNKPERLYHRGTGLIDY